MRYCRYCKEQVPTTVEDNFVICDYCGSNLGPENSSVAIQF